MTVKDYLRIIRQRWLVVLIVVALSTSTALILALRQPPEFAAATRLLLSPTPGTGTDATELALQRGVYKQLNTEAELVKSEVVAQIVIERLGIKGYSVESLLGMMEVATPDSTDVLHIGARTHDPKLTRDLSNAFSEAYIEVRRKQAIDDAERGVRDVSERITKLLAQVEQVEATASGIDRNSTRFQLLRAQRDSLVVQISNLETMRQSLLDQSVLKSGAIGRIIQYAGQPIPVRSTDPIRNAVLGFVIGMPLALGIALLLDSLSDVISDPDQAASVIGAEMLGSIPLSPEWKSAKPYIVAREAPYSAAAEAYRTLRINLNSRVPEGSGKQIMLTSPGAGEGKSLATANIAVTFAEAGRSVLAVSADLRRPRLHALFDVSHAPGLSDVLEGAVVKDAIKQAGPNLYVLPSGTPSERPDRLLATADIKAKLSDLKLPQKVRDNRPGDGKLGADSGKKPVGVSPDLVLLDTPAVLGAAEVSAMAGSVDGVVIVVHMGITRRQAALRAAEQIRRAGGKIEGFIVVGVRADRDFSAYPPADGSADVADSTWSKVVGALKR